VRTSSICKRCHRLRFVNAARFCATCEKELRAQEQRRAPPAANGDGSASPPEIEDKTRDAQG